MPFATGRDALPRDPAPHVQRRCKCNNRRSYWCTKSEAGIAALLRILAGCATRGGSIPAVVFDRRATKHPAKIRAALRVVAAPAPRRVASSLNRTSAIRLASALRVIRRRSQRCYTSLRLGALVHAPAQIDKYLIRIAYLHKSKAWVLEVDDHIRSHRQDNGEGDGVQHIQMTSYRHVVAREQRTRERQRAEQ